VVDASRRNLVGVKDQCSNGQPCGIGTGALVTAASRGINAVKVPNRDKRSAKNVVCYVGSPGLVELAVRAINYDEVAVPPCGTLIARLTLQATSDRERYLRNRVRIRSYKPIRLAKGDVGCRGICMQHSQTEVDLHPSKSPSALVGEPVDHGGGLRVEGRVTDVLGPDGAGRKQWRLRGAMLRPCRVDDVGDERKASHNDNDSQK